MSELDDAIDRSDQSEYGWTDARARLAKNELAGMRAELSELRSLRRALLAALGERWSNETTIEMLMGLLAERNLIRRTIRQALGKGACNEPTDSLALSLSARYGIASDAATKWKRAAKRYREICQHLNGAAGILMPVVLEVISNRRNFGTATFVGFDGRRYSITMQAEDGKTPQERIAELERELAAVERGRAENREIWQTITDLQNAETPK